MTTEEQRLVDAGKDLRPCDCGSRVIMSYEPGCTFIWCSAERRSVSALPDFEPENLAKLWNDSPTEARKPARAYELRKHLGK